MPVKEKKKRSMCQVASEFCPQQTEIQSMEPTRQYSTLLELAKLGTDSFHEFVPLKTLNL